MLHKPLHAAANDVAIFLLLMGIAGAEIGQQGQARGGRVGVQCAQRGRIGGDALGQRMKAPVSVVELGVREVLQTILDGRLGELSAGRIADRQTAMHATAAERRHRFMNLAADDNLAVAAADAANARPIAG